MTRAEVRTFIEAGINDLSSAYGFGSGRISEFVSTPAKVSPYCWLESLSNSPEFTGTGFPMNNWNVSIHIAKQDTADSIADEYEAIIDECDEIAAKLQHKYNQVVSGFKLVKLLGISRDPFVKKHGNPIQSGIILSFVLNEPDATNVC